jgi:hypothetical protein
MQYLFSYLFGCIGKIIDDIDDNKLNINPFILDTLKSLNICLFTLASQNDFLFSFSTFILSLFGAGIDNNYWKSFIFISLFLSIIYFSSIDNFPLFILIMGIIIISTRIEENTFPEEFSIKKLFTRILGFIIFITIYFISSSEFLTKISNYSIQTTNINYIRKLILIALGGLSISIISQIYFLWFNQS